MINKCNRAIEAVSLMKNFRNFYPIPIKTQTGANAKGDVRDGVVWQGAGAGWSDKIERDVFSRAKDPSEME